MFPYGRLAEQLNIVTDASTSGWSVGRLLSHIPEAESQLARQRVMNKQGYISTLKLGVKGLEQIRLLQGEWVMVSSEGYIDMVKYE